jgi:hypothetical protein
LASPRLRWSAFKDVGFGYSIGGVPWSVPDSIGATIDTLLLAKNFVKQVAVALGINEKIMLRGLKCTMGRK